MITIKKKKYEKVVTELIYSRDIRQLVTMYSLDKIFYFSVLKDISQGRKSPNYRILRSIARNKNLDENFIVEQAKSVLEFYIPYYRRESPEYYEILNVGTDATEQEIRRSWIELMKSHHPDKVGKASADRAKKINEAYQVLKDNRKRDEYDRKHLPYIPVYVSERGLRENLYYAVPVILVAIVVIAYFGGSGLVFESREAREKSVGVLEDSAQSESAARIALSDNGEESGMKRGEAERAGEGVKEKPAEQRVAGAGDEQEQTDESTAVKPETARKSPQPDKSPLTGDESKPRALALGDGTEGEHEVSHGAAPVEKKPAVEDVNPVEEAPAGPPVREEVAVVSERDGASQGSGKAADEKSEADTGESTPAAQKKDNGEEIAAVERTDKVKEAGNEVLGDSGSTVSAEPEKETPEGAPAEAENEDTEQLKSVAGSMIYTVREGDSLWTIARKFDTRTSELMRLNNLADNKLNIGDELIVRGKGLPVPSVRAGVVKKGPDGKKDSKDAAIETSLVPEKKEATQAPALTEGIKQKTDRLLVPEAKAVEKIDRQPVPDRDSLNLFVSEYVSAYKNGDISKLESLFLPNAVENGVSIKNVLGAYRSNFETLEIITYDINIKSARIINNAGMVEGGFFIKFKDRRTGLTKDSHGRIDWRLVWSGGAWRVSELSYKIQTTDMTSR